MASEISEKAMKCLRRAAKRERGNVCPIIDVRAIGAAQSAIVDALVRRGLVDETGAPRITAKGRLLVASWSEGA